MARFIDIKTNNLSRQLKNTVTNIDNWVYVPGTAITGDWKRPYAFRTLDEFQRVCGTHAPVGSITYKYVAGLLSAGMPVLFRRIAYVNQDKITEQDILKGEVEGVKRAEVVLSHTVGASVEGEQAKTYVDFKIYEKFGGSFGNDIKVSIRLENGNTYYIDVYAKQTLLEHKRLLVIPSSVSDQLEINKLLIDALLKIELDYIDIDVQPDLVIKNAETFQMHTFEEPKELLGGEDIDEGLVGAEIPKSLDFIKDKILYQPKFITSGGYTDEDILTSHPIADALLKLSKERQDCRAIIDLPIGTLAKDYKQCAKAVQYQQNSDVAEIESGSMYGPWCYMQVGNDQEWMPPSYAYLTVMGNSLSHGDKAYTPKAGITSGVVGNIIKPEFEVGSTLAEDWQSDSEVNINPIMRLQGGSYVIAGNSTLLAPDVNAETINAFQESSADLAVIEIRRFIYNLATELQYQYNGTEAFETFSIRCAKFLETMISEGAMSNYDIINMSSDDEPRVLKIQVDVYLTPTIKKIQINLNVAYGSIEVSTGGVE